MALLYIVVIIVPLACSRVPVRFVESASPLHWISVAPLSASYLFVRVRSDVRSATEAAAARRTRARVGVRLWRGEQQ